MSADNFMDQFTKVIDDFGRISRLAQAGDLQREARALIQPKCGNCEHWMKKSDCPAESVSKPSSNSAACKKHLMVGYIKRIYDGQMAEAADLLKGLA